METRTCGIVYTGVWFVQLCPVRDNDVNVCVVVARVIDRSLHKSLQSFYEQATCLMGIGVVEGGPVSLYGPNRPYTRKDPLLWL